MQTYNRGVTLTLRALLDSPALGLQLRGAATGTLETSIDWAAATELENPQPFLSGGELLLTSGARLKTATAQRTFIRAAKRAGAVGVGFGVGFEFATVPDSMIAEANRWDLPIVEVPFQTPFLAIVKRVTQAHNAHHVAQLQKLLAQHQSLAHALLASNSRGSSGLEPMLRLLASMTGTDIVLKQHGLTLFTSTADPVLSSDAWTAVPVPAGTNDAAALWLRKPLAEQRIVDYARNLLSLELVNQATRRSEARVASGRLFGEVVSPTLPRDELTEKLRSLGLEPDAPLTVLYARATIHNGSRAAALPLPDSLEAAAVTCLYEDGLVLVASWDAKGALRAANTLNAYLSGAGVPNTVGVGGGYVGAQGMRWSYVEAKEASAKALPVNKSEALSLTSLLLASQDVPLAELAQETLAPLFDFDAAHSADLVYTLRSYLNANGSLAAVATQLNVHRNTVRYRLAQVFELTGLDPAFTADRVQLWLALSVSELR